jgi:hypothetical protein
MQWWLRNHGSAQRPHTRDDWRAGGPLWDTVGFPLTKRPSARGGDRMLYHAVGSSRMFGDGLIFALSEVTSDEPFLDHRPERRRWPWALEVEVLVELPLLSMGVRLREIGKTPRSLSQHSYIRLTPEQGELAERLLRERAAGG